MKLDKFWVSMTILLVIGFAFTKLVDNEFYFFAIYSKSTK